MSPSLTAPDLWFSARAMLAKLMHCIGVLSLGAIARLSRAERAELLDWLVTLEAMTRKLLLIEAAALTPRRAQRRRAACVGEAGVAPSPRHPAFNLLPAPAREPAHPARIRQLGPPVLVRDIWRDQAHAARLARLQGAAKPQPHARLLNRIAALTRAIAKPLPHARRLARLLRRLKTRAATVARCIAAVTRRRALDLFQIAAYDHASQRAAMISNSS